MKLLGWMHRKLRQNTNETPKDFSIGYTDHSSLDDLHCYRKETHGRKLFSKAERDNYRRNSFTSLEASRVDHEEEEETITELFHGFLAIGTLGTETIPTDPGTPTFSISMDNIAEKETEVTENELKLINDELEKVLGDDSCNASSGRNSQVSAGRISYCSAITLSGKPIIKGDETNANGGEGIRCQLQGSLFGSAIGLPDTEPVPEKREHRTSLGELFQKTKQAEDNNSVTKSERCEKSAVHVVKKMLKRRSINVNASSKSSSGGAVDSTTSEKKLHKILHIFNRKVHPENSTSCNQALKPTKNEIKNNNNHLDCGGRRSSTEDIIIYPDQAISKDSTWSCKSKSHSPHLVKSSGDATENEFWVKTDVDYFVLEL